MRSWRLGGWLVFAFYVTCKYVLVPSVKSCRVPHLCDCIIAIVLRISMRTRECYKDLSGPVERNKRMTIA